MTVKNKPFDAHAKSDSSTWIRAKSSFAKVGSTNLFSLSTSASPSTDACDVKNGGCDANALCSHDATTNEVVCTCKTGYTNTGTAPTVTCTGKLVIRRSTYLDLDPSL